jgi:hypothetical protein
MKTTSDGKYENQCEKSVTLEAELYQLYLFLRKAHLLKLTILDGQLGKKQQNKVSPP